MTKILAQIAEACYLFQQQFAVAAVGASIMAGHGFADKRMATAQFCRVVIPVAVDITARQHCAFGPG
ncbi:hypothetical protein D3C87_2110410 [compost metagenome]